MTHNGTVCPDPFLPYYPVANAALEAKYALMRVCYNGCCAPCVPGDFTDNETGPLLKVLKIVSFITFSGCTFLLGSRVLIPGRFCHLNAHSVCQFVAIAIFSSSIAWFLVASPAQTWCYNSITRSVWYNNWRCALQGVLYVFGIHSMLLWLCVRILALYLSMCHRRSIGIWKPTALVFGISLIFALVSIPFLQYNRLNLICSPTGGGPLIGLILTPLLVYVIIGSSTQILNAVHITRTVISVRLSSDTSDEYDLSTETGINRKNIMRKTRTRRIITALWIAAKLQWRTVVFSVFLMVSTVFLTIDFLIIDANQEGGKIADGLSQWITCILNSSLSSTSCDSLLPLFFPVSRIAAGYILMMLAGIFLLLIEVRISLLRAWWFLLLHPQAIFIRAEWNEFDEPIQRRSSEHSATEMGIDRNRDRCRPPTPTSFRAMDYIVRHIDDAEQKESTREQSRRGRKSGRNVSPTDTRSRAFSSSKNQRRDSWESASSGDFANLPSAQGMSSEDSAPNSVSTIPSVHQTHPHAIATLQDDTDGIKEDRVHDE